MNEELKEWMTSWFSTAPVVRGVLVRAIRFADETFVTDVDARDFTATALEQAWRLVADTFQVLSAQRLPPSRLTWTYEKTILHCVRRTDGSIMGVFMSRKSADVDLPGLEKLLGDFQKLELPAK